MEVIYENHSRPRLGQQGQGLDQQGQGQDLNQQGQGLLRRS